MHGGHARQLPHQRHGDAAGLLEAVTVERLLGLGQALGEHCGALAVAGLAPIVARRLGRDGTRLAGRRAGSAARLAASAASARMAPSSIHSSAIRDSIFARSASGSRRPRGRLGVDLGGPALGCRQLASRTLLAPPAGRPTTGAPRRRRGRQRPADCRPVADHCRLVGDRLERRLADDARARRVVPSTSAGTATCGGRPDARPPSWRGGREGRPEDMSVDATAGRKRRRAPPGRRRPSHEKSGGVLLSQGVYPQVPSALAGLTSVFGMGTGVTLSLWPPKSVVKEVPRRTSEDSRASTSCSIQALGRLVPVG